MQFRTKPVEVDAYQIEPNDGHTRALPPAWVIEAVIAGRIQMQPSGGVLIVEPQGTKCALVSDWLVRNAQGEVHVLDAKEFASTYERVA